MLFLVMTPFGPLYFLEKHPGGPLPVSLFQPLLGGAPFLVQGFEGVALEGLAGL
jgi:hypothetical protein